MVRTPESAARLDTEIRTGFLKFEGVVELFFDETHKNEVKKRGNFGQELQNQRKSVSSLLQYFRGSCMVPKVPVRCCHWLPKYNRVSRTFKALFQTPITFSTTEKEHPTSKDPLSRILSGLSIPMGVLREHCSDARIWPPNEIMKGWKI